MKALLVLMNTTVLAASLAAYADGPVPGPQHPHPAYPANPGPGYSTPENPGPGYPGPGHHPGNGHHEPGHDQGPGHGRDCARQNLGGIICEGDRVVSRNNNENTGVVVNLRRDHAMVRMESGLSSGRMEDYDIDVLAREARCFQNICAGLEVMSRGNEDNIGTVRTVFENGSVRVAMTTGLRVNQVLSYSAQQIAPAIEWLGSIRRGAVVISRTNDINVGRVLNVFENGKARVMMTAGVRVGQEVTYDVVNISAAVPCTGGVCVGSTVVSRMNSANRGEVVGAFECGKIRVRMQTGWYAGQEMTYEASQVFVVGGPHPGHGPGDHDHGHGHGGPVHGAEPVGPGHGPVHGSGPVGPR